MKFPTEYDALDLTTEELREKLKPASRRLQDIQKERRDRVKVRKRTKGPAVPNANPEAGGDVDLPLEPPVETAELEDEDVIRARERAELEELISPEVKEDVGASSTGLYDLVGAYYTHSTSVWR